MRLMARFSAQMAGYNLLTANRQQPIADRWHLHHNIFRYYLSVKHSDNPVAVSRIVLGVRHHDDCRALFIQIGEELHHLIPV